MPALRIIARDPASRARAGVLETAHGEVRTPAFVPLATRGSVRGLGCRRGRRARLRHRARQHLPPVPEPGRRADRALRRAAPLHGLGRAIITDSGGFQVFSMGHGTVADEIKGSRRASAARARSSRSRSRAFAFAPTSTAASASSARRSRWRCRRSCAPTSCSRSTSARRFTSTRDYTARSTERTHRWLERALAWRAAHGGAAVAVLRDRPGRRLRGPADRVGRGRGRERRRRRSRSAARSAARRRRCTRSSSWTTRELERLAPGAPAPPARDRRGRRPDPRRRAGHRQLRLRDADPPRAPRRRARGRPVEPLAARGRPRRPGATTTRAADRRLPVPGVRRRALARLPALPRRARAR